MTAIVLTRADTMPGFNHLELDEVHTPSSDYSNFAQPTMLSSNASGIFSFCQTGPADLGGSSWDATAEGPQNFPDYSDHADYYAGDTEDFVLPFGQITPKPDLSDAMDDLHTKWTPAAAPEAKASLKAEPMRRVTSRSSNGSSKNRTLKASSSSKKSRPRVQSILSQASAHMSKLDMTGNASSAFQDGPMANGRMIDVQQYLAQAQDLDSLSVTSHVTGPAFYPGMLGFAEGLHYPSELDTSMAQHVNPQIFNAGLAGHSPQSWGSLSPVDSRMSSPGIPDAVSDGVWSAVPSASSPEESHDSNSPHLNGQSPRMTRNSSQFVTSEDLHGNGMPAIGEDGFALPPAFGARRMSGEGESARDHYLYKNAFPHTDGLFHCPWEGQPSCNHKAEKLKCNYDKFVDSHLKPYRCKVEGCQNARFSSTACLLRHEREAHAMHGHGEKPYLCTYEGCERSLPGHGFPRQWNLRDHMRRVHNDNGTAAAAAAAAPQASSDDAAPAASSSGTATTSARGRKRKSDSQEKTTTSSGSSSSRDKSSSNKASSKAVETKAAAAEVQTPEIDIDRWYEHRKALQTLVQGYYQPDDPQSLQYIKDAQDHLAAMGKISHEVLQNQGTYRRGSWKG
ncbi:zinc finger protein GLI2 [Diplogelasinospora grovesii]|uniref:Zinc finger protein GLI2 n=1 Tax=Diplogelasinospora grovesii TaxID=303347 RepID=A0AAN6NFJ2_9PEZI|nr:zinc finger protein GLI2 [Diplogelasinospora grovesii]